MDAFDATLADFLRRHTDLKVCRQALVDAFALLCDCVVGGHKIITCGNGGSASDAEHIVGELMKSFAFHRPLPASDQARLRELFPEDANQMIGSLEAPIPAISLVSQVALNTAFANDVSYEFCFAQQVLGLGQPGDVLLAISTSGNSKNVVQACRAAQLRHVRVISLTGEAGGEVARHSDVAIRVPSTETHLVQEYHLPVYHLLCFALEERLFAEHGRR